jgi:5-oxopent-3-ene-1,2,5-tricarboxylate decarboxylase/2-hydroxyhepta-2,4-diene-1,7-dioate isomerase
MSNAAQGSIRHAQQSLPLPLTACNSAPFQAEYAPDERDPADQGGTVKRARVQLREAVLEVTAAGDGSLRTAAGDALAAEEVRWLPPACTVLIGAALNQASELAALQAAFNAPPHKTPPRSPVLFVKTPNTFVGHGAPVQCPPESATLQPGGALVVVIGRRIPMRAGAEQRLAGIAGYTILNDFSLPQASYYRPPVRLKGFDGFGPLGPWVVDAADVPDPHALEIRTLVNGKIRQRASMRDLVHDIPALLESINTFTGLNAGDMLAVSVPVDRIDVGPGDTVSIEIDGVGVLSNPVVAAGARPAPGAR